MIRRVLLLLLLSAAVANAQIANLLPSQPVFLAGPQGRPLPGTVVNITHPDGTPADTWLDQQGLQPFNNIVRVDQILQFWTFAGLYIVNVWSEGMSKQFWVTVGAGLPESAKIISVDRTPDLFLLNTAAPPVLSCPINNNCVLAYDAFFKETAFIDFVMPSFPLALTSVLLTYSTSSAVGGTAQWLLSSCVYKTGEPPCDISIASVTVFDNHLAPSGVRNDLSILGSQLPFSWSPGDHVLFAVSTSLRDFFPLDLQNLRLEFTRQ